MALAAAGELERVIAVDWSGRIDAPGQRRHIWAGIWTGGKVTLEAGRTREELVSWLIELSRETRWPCYESASCFAPAYFRILTATHQSPLSMGWDLMKRL